MADLRIEVYRGQIVPYRWFWRLLWDNGKVAATSKGVVDKRTAELQAQKLADRLGVPVEIIAPCVI